MESLEFGVSGSEFGVPRNSKLQTRNSKLQASPAVISLLLGAGIACAPTDGATPRDVRADDAGATDDSADAPDVPAGALVPVAPPVEVHVTRDAVLGPIVMAAVPAGVAVLWGERDPVAGSWAAPGFALVGQDGAVAAGPIHPPDTGRRPVGLAPGAGPNELAYFTLTAGSGCDSTIHRQALDAAGRLLAAPVAVETLDDARAVHVAAIGANVAALAVEGGACTPRAEPAARVLLIGSRGNLAGSVPLGPARRISALAARPGGSGYLAIRDTEADGVVLDTLGPGGGSERRWTIARRQGTCECPSSAATLAPAGTGYLAAWSGEIEGVQSWFLHAGPYFDDAEWGVPPRAVALAAAFNRPVGAVVSGTRWVVAYVPADRSAPFRIDLFDESGRVEPGWSADVPGDVTWVAIAPLGRRVAVAWVEVWAGAAAPALLMAGLFEPPSGP